ncbi:MAG TPA: hypothetical protein VGN43_02210, partial [Steroidobacteraceae bacterium]|nr:hypothetical protein [Steroidobacteraceae bacterium]
HFISLRVRILGYAQKSDRGDEMGGQGAEIRMELESDQARRQDIDPENTDREASAERLAHPGRDQSP